jgi:hypothetical protein
MSMVQTGPSATVAQLSGHLPTGEFMLSVLAKRTYMVDPNGRFFPADVQVPILEAPEPDPDNPALMGADSDHHPYKLRTDVVVRGHAYGDDRARGIEAMIRVGRHEKRIAVLGERTCSVGRSGSICWSEPAPIDKVSLSYENAYGGRDRSAEARYGNPLLEDPMLVKSMTDIDLDAASPFLYPRNPAGRGYLIEATPEAIERLSLPLLEDPQDLLTPERIVARKIERWHRMPLPQSTHWVDYGWYPRVAFFGVVPIVDWFDEPPLEVERHLVPDYLADGTGTITPQSRFEFASGASLGLQIPYLRGGEAVELHHLHLKQPHWRATVPRAPRLWTDGRNGRLNSADPVLHTLIIEPDESRVTAVWRGCAAAIRPYAPQELEQMPLRVEWRDG